MRKILSLAAAVASAFAMGSAQAELLAVDTFNSPTGQVTNGDTTVGGGFVNLFGTQALSGQIATSRIIEQNTIANQLGGNNSTEVSVGGGATGFLQINHDSGVNSEVRVTWEIDDFTLAPAQSAILFQVIFAALGQPSVAIDLDFEFFDLGNNSLFTKSVNLIALPGPQTFALSASEASDFSQGGKLVLLMTGTPGWNLVVDEFSISVPEPTSLALAGLALVGAGVASRRRKA